MVRRDANEKETSQEEDLSVASCASPTGESPVPVSAEAPGSRSQAPGEIPVSRAGRQEPVSRREPCSGEQVRGPQHEVKSAASTDEQSEGRAAHFTAKATRDARAPEHASRLGGVRDGARVQGEERNTRGPSALPSSRQGGSHKPKVKAIAAQRESEGVVVLQSDARASRTNVVKKNAAGGKGLCFGHAREGGKREGMAAESGPNDPGARTCTVQVREPRGELSIGAKRRVTTAERRPCPTRGDARVCNRSSPGPSRVHASSRRPSVSRVREIRTHGLNGGPTGIQSKREGR